jgi:hypothetical protein
MPIVKHDIASWLKNYAPAMPIALSMNRGQEYPNEDHAFDMVHYEERCQDTGHKD